MDNQFRSERAFNLYAADINGKYLLIRGDGDSNLDILFKGISYIELKNYFNGVEIRLSTVEERNKLNQKLNFKDTAIDNYYVISSGGEQFFIRAQSISVFENTLGFKKHYNHEKPSQDRGDSELLYERINDGAKEFRDSEFYAHLYPEWNRLKEQFNDPYKSSRTFHLWAVNLIHFGILFKSISKEDKTIDIVLTGANYLEIKTQLDGISIDVPTLEEQTYLQQKCHLEFPESSKTSVICSNKERFFIRASFLSITTHNSKSDEYSWLIEKEDFGKLIYS